MAQIVYDLAPGAQLGFASAFNGLYEFADNIHALRDWGANIIADDVYYYEEPLFQDGPVSVAISDVVSSGVMYYTSAGNSNADLNGLQVASYEAASYRPTTCPLGLTYPGKDCHNFNFNPTGTAVNADQVTLAANGTLDIDLQWSEPWNGVVTDFDLYLLDMSGNVVESDYTTNSGPGGTQQPFAYIYHQNLTGSPQTYQIVITRYDGTGTPRIKFFFSQNTSKLTYVEFNMSAGEDTVGPTISGHSASRYVSSVGATPYDNANSVEIFSSRGPAAHYWGPVIGTLAASPIETETLLQPDFTATDLVCTTFFFINDGTSKCYRFQGTSAAAPHAAAVAALVLQAARRYHLNLNQYSMKALLQSTAVTITTADSYAAGAGRLDAFAAMTAILPYHASVPIVSR